MEEGAIKNSEELRKLKRRVTELEVEVEQLMKKKDRNNRANEIVTWTVAVLELAAAIIALAASLAR